MREKIKTTNVLIRLSPQVKSELDEIAEFRGVSMTAIITMLLREEYNKIKYEKAELKKLEENEK